MAAGKKKAKGKKSPASRGPDLEVVEVRFHPASDASLRLRKALSLILKAADAEGPEGREIESAGYPEGGEGSREKKCSKGKKKNL